MSSTTDFLTTNKNGVVAINNLNQTIAAQTTALTAQADYYKGQYTSAPVTASTLISAGSGYLVNVAILVAGAAGNIYDSATTGSAGSSNLIYPTVATVGFTAVGMRFTDGLVVIPGEAQTVVVTYSLD
jgi:hypothetical protein